MRHKKLILIPVIIGVVVTVTLVLSYTGYLIAAKGTKTTVTVARVIDGDTIELANGKVVRLLGIDAPERNRYYYRESKDKLKRLVEGKNVVLEKDVSNTDSRNRLLRYVFVDDMFVNLEMVREGYANVYIVSPDVKYSTELMEAESEAREKGLGIWKSLSLPYSDCIEVVNFHFNAKGNDNENLNDEYVVLENTCNFSVDMTGWTIKDEATNIYTFSDFVLASESTVTIYSGSGEDTTEKIYWNSDRAIWNNDGDTLYLRDVDGNLILVKSYTGY